MDNSQPVTPIPSVQNEAPKTTPDPRLKLEESIRLALRDLSQHVVEIQIPLRETIAKIQEKLTTAQADTTAATPTNPLSTPNESTPTMPPASQTPPASTTSESTSPSPKVENPTQTSVPPPPTPDTPPTPPVVTVATDAPPIEPTQPPVSLAEKKEEKTPETSSTTPSSSSSDMSFTPYAPNLAPYTEALHTLSETGINLLRGIVEIEKKQPGPAAPSPYAKRVVITEKDLVEFLLDEGNDPKLKDFGDLKIVRKVMKDKLGSVVGASTENAFTSTPQVPPPSKTTPPTIVPDTPPVPTSSSTSETLAVPTPPNTVDIKNEEESTPIGSLSTPPPPITPPIMSATENTVPPTPSQPSIAIPPQPTPTTPAPSSNGGGGFLKKFFKRS